MSTKETLLELIDKAYKIKVHFNLGSYEMHQYEDGSYIDFHVQKVVDLPTLQRIAGELELKFFAGDGYLIVRLFERDYY